VRGARKTVRYRGERGERGERRERGEREEREDREERERERPLRFGVFLTPPKLLSIGGSCTVTRERGRERQEGGEGMRREEGGGRREEGGGRREEGGGRREELISSRGTASIRSEQTQTGEHVPTCKMQTSNASTCRHRCRASKCRQNEKQDPPHTPSPSPNPAFPPL
jgi:hypothetical protein